MLVQPVNQSLSRGSPFINTKFQLVEIAETEISHITTPRNSVKHNFNHSPKHFKSYKSKAPLFKTFGELFVIFRKEDMQLIPAETRNALKLEIYMDNDTCLEYLVSAPLAQISNQALPFLQNLVIVSLLRTFKLQ